MKLGCPLAPDKKTRYRIDTYFFAPSSLGINPISYGRGDFFRDIQHYVRMKTPRFRLDEMLAHPHSPLCRCEAALRDPTAKLDEATEHALADDFRRLRAVLKSSAQQHLAPLAHASSLGTSIDPASCTHLLTALLGAVDGVEQRYRTLEQQLETAGASETLLSTYRLTDEAISLLVEDLLLQAHQLLQPVVPQNDVDRWRLRLTERIRSEHSYRRQKGYPSVLERNHTEEYLLRRSALKKYTSSVLWLTTSKRREGTTLEQVLYASAAGVSMIFATVIAFYAQAIFGQLTMPLFVALVVAYMFKDRIKESGRGLAAWLLSQHMYDYRTTIQTQDGRRKLGHVREKMTHIEGDEVPAEVMTARTTGPFSTPEFLSSSESIIVYTKLVELRPDAFGYLGLDGRKNSAINDIMRLDVRPFLRKMDDPYEQRLALDGDAIVPVDCHRTYHLNVVSAFADYAGNLTCERTLVVLDRNGIQRIAQFDAVGAPLTPAEHALHHIEEREMEEVG